MSERLKKLAESKNATWEQLFDLIEEGSEYAEIVAKNPNADAFLIRVAYQALLNEGYAVSAACSVLKNSNIDAELINEIYNDFPNVHTEEDVDYPKENCYPVLLAINLKTPFELIKILSNSPFYFVRECLAERSNLQIEIQKKLAIDESRHVRQILASNPTIDKSVLNLLANDKEDCVRFKIALHKNTPKSTLKILTKDKNIIIQEASSINEKLRYI